MHIIQTAGGDVHLTDQPENEPLVTRCGVSVPQDSVATWTDEPGNKMIQALSQHELDTLDSPGAAHICGACRAA